MRPTASRWLLAISFATVFGLVVPALAAGADAAVLEAPASAEPAVPAGEVTPADDTVAESSEPATPPEASGGVAEAPPTEVAEPPATEAAPTEAAPTEAPAPPPSDTPVAEAPVPGTEATPTSAPAPTTPRHVTATPLPVTPDVPVTPATLTVIPTAPQAPADRIAAVAPTIPAVSVAPTAPDAPRSLSGPAGGTTTPTVATPRTAAPITDFVSAILDPTGPTAVGDSSKIASQVVPAAEAPSVTQFAEGATVDLTAPQLVAPVGAAPAGSSLLAVLAGYVLPGSSGPPASTLVLLIVIGLILGVGYAARPQLSEAVASLTLLGASSGHAMAVRRPG